MAVPTISSVTPNTGHSGGQTLVEIVGTGFALPPAPAAIGKTVAPPPSMTVSVDGRAATNVAVVSATLLYCLMPKGDPDGGARALVVQNNDAAGAPVVGETATLADAFTYARPNLTEESELARVLRAFIEELQRQVIANVSFSTHTDYDADTGDLMNLALVGSLPAIVLGNVEVPDGNGDVEEKDFDANTGFFISRRPPVTVDVRMTLVGVVDNPITIMNLLQVVRLFFRKNPWLEVVRDPDDLSRGVVMYPLDWSIAGPATVSHQGDNSNIESFAGTVVIRDVLLEDIPGVSRAKPPGIPAHFPHEATTRFGAKADDEDAVVVEPTQKL